jgi:hypothetical protein
MKTALIVVASLILLETAQAQQFIGGSHYNYGNARGAPVGNSVIWTAQDEACHRANYASTLALERCNAQLIARIQNSRRTRRYR